MFQKQIKLNDGLFNDVFNPLFKATLTLACRYNFSTRPPQQTLTSYAYKGKGKGKAVPLQARSGPEGSRKLSFPDFVTTAQDCGKVVSPYAPAAFTPRKYSWYSFLLDARSIPWP